MISVVFYYWLIEKPGIDVRALWKNKYEEEKESKEANSSSLTKPEDQVNLVEVKVNDQEKQ